MRKKKTEEVHGSLERWLLTYADLITLLLGLFVILYALSKVDLEKFQKMSAALDEVFGSGVSILPGTTMPKPSIIPTVALRSRLDSIRMEMMSALGKIPQSEGVTFEQNQFGLVLHFQSRLLFETGKADLKEDSYTVLDAVGKELLSIPNDILIEGHTDTIPIHNEEFASNVYLSFFRAMNTYTYLIEAVGVPRDRISVRGLGEFKPLAPNNSDSNMAKNRRVDIVIIKDKEPSREKPENE